MGNLISLGIVGLIVLAVLGICAWGQLPAIYFLGSAVVVVIALILISVNRTLKNNPASVLEDALYLEHRKLEMQLASKNLQIIQATPLIEDPEPPRAAIEGTVEPLEDAE